MSARFDSFSHFVHGHEAYPFDVHRPYEAVLPRRAFAFVVDAFLVGLLAAPLAFFAFLLGVLTFGLGWLLIPPLFVVVALLYVAVTVGGPASATVGMRIMDLELRTRHGEGPSPVLATTHAVLFWLSVTLLTPFVLLIGLVTARRQLLHDLLADVVVVNSAAFRH